MSTKGAVAVPVDEQGSDGRWMQWVTEAAKNDRMTQRRTVWLQAVAGCAVVGWLLYALSVRY